MANKFRIEVEKETDGRWIADVQELPGVLVYGKTKKDAVAKAEALARIAKKTGLKPENL